jgi:hypothetical protein
MMESYLVGIGCSFGLAAIIAFFWVRGIDNMMKNHPDYKGEDWLNWGEDSDIDKKEEKDQIQ